jgi:hypothetical protein
MHHGQLYTPLCKRFQDIHKGRSLESSQHISVDLDLQRTEGCLGEPIAQREQRLVALEPDDTIGESMERRFRDPEPPLVEQRKLRPIQLQQFGSFNYGGSLEWWLRTRRLEKIAASGEWQR